MRRCSSERYYSLDVSSKYFWLREYSFFFVLHILKHLSAHNHMPYPSYLQYILSVYPNLETALHAARDYCYLPSTKNRMSITKVATPPDTYNAKAGTAPLPKQGQNLAERGE